MDKALTTAQLLEVMHTARSNWEALGFWGVLLHANVRWRFRWMDGWWGTPDYHHWHHSNHPEDAVALLITDPG